MSSEERPSSVGASSSWLHATSDNYEVAKPITIYIGEDNEIVNLMDLDTVDADNASKSLGKRPRVASDSGGTTPVSSDLYIASLALALSQDVSAGQPDPIESFSPLPFCAPPTPIIADLLGMGVPVPSTPPDAFVPNPQVGLNAETRVSHLSMGTLSTLIVDAVTSGTKSIKDAVDLGFDNIRGDLDRVESAQKHLKEQVQEVQENSQQIEKSVGDQGALLEDLRSRVSKLEVAPKPTAAAPGKGSGKSSSQFASLLSGEQVFELRFSGWPSWSEITPIAKIVNKLSTPLGGAIVHSTLNYPDFLLVQFQTFAERKDAIDKFKANPIRCNLPNAQSFQLVCRINQTLEEKDRTKELRLAMSVFYSQLGNSIDLTTVLKAAYPKRTLCLHNTPVCFFVNGTGENLLGRFASPGESFCVNVTAINQICLQNGYSFDSSAIADTLRTRCPYNSYKIL